MRTKKIFFSLITITLLSAMQKHAFSLTADNYSQTLIALSGITTNDLSLKKYEARANDNTYGTLTSADINQSNFDIAACFEPELATYMANSGGCNVTATASGGATICSGSSVNLSASCTAYGSYTIDGVAGTVSDQGGYYFNFYMAPGVTGSTITGISYTVGLGSYCTSWYYTTFYVNSTNVGTHCNGTYSYTGLNGTSSLTTNIFRLYLYDNDTYADNTIFDLDVTMNFVTTTATYSWSPTTGLSNPNIANPTANPTSTTTYTVTTTTSDGCTASASTTVTVDQPSNAGSITQTPANNGSVCVGGGVQYNCSGMTGTFNEFQYQWNGTGGLYSQLSTSNPYTWTSNSAGNDLYVRSKVTNGVCPAAYSSTVKVSVVAQPTAPTAVTKSPDVGSVCAGTQVSVSSPTGGISGLSCSFQYRFQRGTTTVQDWSSTTSYTTQIADAGNTINLQVRRTGCQTGCNPAESGTLASWNVVAQPSAPTSVTKNPNVASVCAGTQVSVSSPLGGNDGLSCSFQYRFQRGSTTVQDWSSTAIYTTQVADAGNAINVQVRRTGCYTGCNTAESGTLANWNVVADPVAQTITATPASGSTICLGGAVSATFSGGSGGTGTITDNYQYSVDGGGIWSTYTPGNSVTSTSTGTNRVLIRTWRTADGNDCNTSGYNTVQWTVVADPIITMQPVSNITLCIGETSDNITISASGGTGSITFQWQYNNGGSWGNVSNGTPSGVTYSGATSSTFNITNYSIAGTYQYRCIVSTSGLGCDALTSQIVDVYVPSNNLSPEITSTLLCGGTAVGGNTTEISSHNINVYDGVTLIGTVFVPAGQTTWWVTVSPALVAGASITAQVADAGSGCPSAPSPAVIVIGPNAGTVSGTTPLCIGASNIYTTNGTGGGSWSSSAPAVATVNPLTGKVLAVSNGNADITYTISDGTCIKTATKTVTVSAVQNATISAGGPTTFCDGGSVTLTANGGSTYLWSTGATTPSIVASVSGSYTVAITSGCGSAVSAPTVVMVNSPPVGIITGDATYCAGTPTVLSAATSIAGSGSINGYQWYLNGTALGADANNANGTSVSYTASAPGTYTVRISDSNGCSTVACP